MAYRYICMEAEIVSMVTRKQLYGIQLCAELKPPPYIIKDVHTQLLPYYTKKRMMRPYSAVHNSVIRCALVPVNHVEPLLPRITEWQVSKWIVWPDSNRAFVARIYEDKS